MDRVGRIIDWKEGVALVEVGLHQECVSGSCSDCHAAPRDRWTFLSPWMKPYVIGQRVLVKERRGAFRLLRWLAFLAAFCAVLAAGQALVPAARARETAAQRGMIVLGIALGAAGWFAVRAWSRRQPPFRVEPLDPATPDLPHLRARRGSGSPGPRPGAVRAAPASSPVFVGIDEIQRVDER